MDVRVGRADVLRVMRGDGWWPCVRILSPFQGRMTFLTPRLLLPANKVRNIARGSSSRIDLDDERMIDRLTILVWKGVLRVEFNGNAAEADAEPFRMALRAYTSANMFEPDDGHHPF